MLEFKLLEGIVVDRFPVMMLSTEGHGQVVVVVTFVFVVGGGSGMDTVLVGVLLVSDRVEWCSDFVAVDVHS